MQIQINTANNVVKGVELDSTVEQEVRDGLSRFRDRLTRVEVHFNDESSVRRGETDTRCMIEARPRGQGPVTVTEHAATVALAMSGALRKLTAALESEFGKQDDHRGH